VKNQQKMWKKKWWVLWHN